MEGENRVIKDNLKKINKLKSLGIDLYPSKTKRSFSIKKAVENFEKIKESKKKIYLAGRVIAIRIIGKISFLKISDEFDNIQAILKKEITKNYDLVEYISLGDIVNIKGYLDYSQTGEKSIIAESFNWLTKVIRPLPKEYYKIKDEEILATKRYLTTLLWPEKRKPFYIRAKVYKALRSFLDKNGFIEVETPILQTHYGGALARPFKTYLNALKLPLYLRIAPELYLKKMIVGGFERIYEIGKDFRNEGIDREHNPEFSMIELYVAWKDVNWLIKFTEKIIKEITKKIYPDLIIEYQNNKVDLKEKWEIKSYIQILEEKAGLNYFKNSLEDFKKVAIENNIEFKPKLVTKAKLADEIFKKLIRPNIIKPTFLVDIPKDLSPLAKSKKENPEITERMQLYLFGFEIANGFSELNDPIDQKERFKEQQRLLKKGDVESHPYDKTFIEALEYGLPPTAGLGIGLDRVIMILSNEKSIRDVIYFPFVKRS
jgi:lysyl-tRNA synthetase class 2